MPPEIRASVIIILTLLLLAVVSVANASPPRFPQPPSHSFTENQLYRIQQHVEHGLRAEYEAIFGHSAYSEGSHNWRRGTFSAKIARYVTLACTLRDYEETLQTWTNRTHIVDEDHASLFLTGPGWAADCNLTVAGY